MTLASRVFEVITSRLISRADDLFRFAQSGFSFEEWCNWEAYAACCSIEGWSAHPKPRYSDCGLEDSRELGDLLVLAGTERLLVEVGLVLDSTQNKWIAKLDADLAKLSSQLSPGISGLHMIVLVSAVDSISDAEVWQKWLQKVGCWNKPTSLMCQKAFEPGGQLYIKGWGIPTKESLNRR